MIIKKDYFTMSDGIKLFNIIALPEENKKLPIVFIRTPYESKRDRTPYLTKKFRLDLFTQNGYAVILQHTRGFGGSEGECIPYDERSDGLDSLEVIRTLPFYNGEIYVTGGSYLSTVHLCYLGSKPHDVKAAALSIQTDRMYFRNYRNGCCYNFCNLGWWAKDMLKNRYPEQTPVNEAIYRPYYKIIERIVSEDVPEYTGMLLNDTYNEFWKNDPRTDVIDKLDIPVLFTEGWYDFYIDGMFSMWERLPQKTKLKSAFAVGPWGHATAVSDFTQYPLENGNLPADYIVKFFNSVRDNTAYKELALGKVNYYSIGGDFWTTDKPSAIYKKLYFNNDGTLSDKHTVSGEQSYMFNPDKPLNYFKFGDILKAPKQNTDGVLSFVSEPICEDISFYGKIQWHMNVKTDCDDTAFFMRIYFIENGEAYNLTETITSLSHINENYKANEECMVDIYTPPIGFTLKKGCSLRVDISSHSDIYVPHSNVKGHWAKVTESKIAKNTIICDEEAYIVLPICE